MLRLNGIPYGPEVHPTNPQKPTESRPSTTSASDDDLISKILSPLVLVFDLVFEGGLLLLGIALVILVSLVWSAIH